LVTSEYKIVFSKEPNEFSVNLFGCEFEDYCYCLSSNTVTIESDEDHFFIIKKLAEYFEVTTVGLVQRIVSYEPDWSLLGEKH
jgi:hypothetical protein